MLTWRERSNCLSWCWDSCFKSWVHSSLCMDLHYLTWGLRRTQAHTTAQAWSRQEDCLLCFFSLLKLVCSASSILLLCALQLHSCCDSKTLCVSLLFSRQVCSETKLPSSFLIPPCRALGQLGTCTANPGLDSSWKLISWCLSIFAELSNKVKREDIRIDSARCCPRGDLAQVVIWGVEKPSLRLITWQPLFKRMDVWFNTRLIIKSWRSQLTDLPLKRNCSSQTPEESRVWLSDYMFHCKAVM